MKKTISILLAALMLMSTFAGLNLTAFADIPDGWVKGKESGWYYYEGGSPVCNEWRKVDGKWYWFFDDGEMAANCRVGIPDSSGKECVYVFSKSGAMLSNGWGKIDGDGIVEWHYLTKSGAAVTEAWKKVSGKWYWFDDSGVMVSDDIWYIGKKFYAFDKNGALHEKAGWLKYSWELFDEDENKIGDEVEWVYTNKDGSCYTGWKKAGGYWYYLSPDYGYMIKDGIFRIGADKNMDLEGALLGYANVGKLYAFDKNGKMLSNQWYKGVEDGGYPFEELNESFEYLSSCGTYNWYYLGSDGAAVTGWKQIKGTWYLFVKEIGLSYMLAERITPVTKDGYSASLPWNVADPYIFQKSGAMLANSWYSHIDEKTGEKLWYYAGSNGVLYRGWHKIGGSWYYFATGHDNGDTDEDGEIVHYCEMKTGWIELYDGVYYCDPVTGKMVTGTVKIDGKNYYFDSSGRYRPGDTK